MRNKSTKLSDKAFGSFHYLTVFETQSVPKKFQRFNTSSVYYDLFRFRNKQQILSFIVLGRLFDNDIVKITALLKSVLLHVISLKCFLRV